MGHGRDESLLQQKNGIAQHFTKDGGFRRAYGVPGLYYSDINPDSNDPLVMIQSSDLARFAAIKQLAAIEDSNRVEELRVAITHQYLKEEKGMSDKAIKTLTEIFGK